MRNVMKKRLPLVALALGCLAVLALGGFAGYRANLFGLRELLPGRTPRITLAGLAGSPEFLAAREWLEFTAEHDMDGALLAQVGEGSTGLDPRFDLYMVYTQEMANKLDEITARHGLALHTSVESLHGGELLEARLGGALLPDGYEMFSGYIYPSNSFFLEGYAYFGEGRGVSFQLMNARRGYFSEVVLHIGDAEQFDSWRFTAGRQPLLLALGPQKSLVLADTGRSFVTINVLGGSACEHAVTRADLEAFAEGFDFALLR